MLLVFIFGICINFLLAATTNSSYANERQSLFNEAQQQVEVTGTVTDAQTGDPLPGVNIVIQGTTRGTTTDMDGNYSIEAPEDATLVFSFVGYQEVTVNIEGQQQINVEMEQAVTELEEVVAVGYGTQQRRDITGSVSSVDMEEAPTIDIPNTNVLSALKGQISGLNIGAANSAGDQPGMLIRGQNSISASNAPLIVLDGVIYQGALSDINLDNIATVDVLKDASATAVYGSRAANGVLLLTSKKGEKGKPIIRLNTSTGVNMWQQKQDIMGPEKYLQIRMDRRQVDDPLDIPELKTPEEENIKAGNTVDWYDLGSRVGLNQDYQLSVSGGGEDINYFVSGGYNNEEGVIVGDQFEKVSLTAKVDADITDWLEMGVDGRYSYRTYEGVGANKAEILRAPPYGNAYVTWEEGGEKKRHYEKYPVGESSTNALWGTTGKTVEDIQDLNFFRFNGYADIEIPFIEGLSYRLNYSHNLQTNNTGRFYNEMYYVDEGYGTIPPIERYGQEALNEKLNLASGNKVERTSNDYLIDNIVSYKRDFGGHSLDVTLVATRDYSRYESVTIEGSDFESLGNTNLGVNGLHKADVTQINNSISETANIGYLGRVSYAFESKYHLTASYRRDGSSVFGSERKWGDFPSVGVAWTASEENFLGSNDFIDYLKFKASYGKNGNQAIGPYTTLTTVNTGRESGFMYEYGHQPSQILYGMDIARLGNPELGWETTTAFNAGFNSVFWDNKISFDVDFYFSKTTDQLFVRNIPIMTGFSQIRSSMGQVNNRGIELSLNTTNVQTQDLVWESNLTFWQNRNILEELYGDGKDDIANNLFLGESLGAIYGYEKVGIVQEDDTEYMENVGAKPGDVKFKDINGDGNITADYDRKILGFTKPNFRMNFSNTLNYKGFQFYALIQGIFGGGENSWYTLDNLYAYRILQKPSQNQYNHPWWTPENQNNTYPSPRYFGERFQGLQARTFVRIQDVSLSYNFDNQPWLETTNINSLRLYAGIRNLYTFTGWDGGDPEEGNRAMGGNYPVPTTYSLGLDISF